MGWVVWAARPFCFMADIERISDIVNSIVLGFEDKCLECMEKNRDIIEDSIREQLYAGRDSNGQYLNPSYDNDPYFNEDGIWKGRQDDYKIWKEKITPPSSSYLLSLPPRPLNIPNLKITGKFYESINVSRVNDEIQIKSSGFDEGASIISKYGDKILGVGDTAIDYFNNKYMLPWLEEFYKDCGYEL